MLLQNSQRITASDDPSKIQGQLQLLDDWLGENPQINACRNQENLHFFLSNCKYDLERTKKKIKSFYQMRAERVEWFANRDPFSPEIQALLNIGIFLPIDGLDVEKRKVVVIRTAAHDPKIHTQNNFFKVSKMILDLLLKFEPENCSNGIVAIFDMKGVQLGHALQLNPALIKRAVDSWQAYPCQPKLLEFINTPMHVNIILNTFRLFMTAKMRSRVVVQKQNCSVKCENLPQDIVGRTGKGPSYKELAQRWKRLVEENVQFYEECDKYKSILTK